MKAQNKKSNRIRKERGRQRLTLIPGGHGLETRHHRSVEAESNSRDQTGRDNQEVQLQEVSVLPEGRGREGECLDLRVEVESLRGERLGSRLSDCGVSRLGWLLMLAHSETDDTWCVKMVFPI
jgi:hypothetical protein